MNWVKENKFLTAFLAVLFIGLGVLGYLTFSASSAYDEASARYTSKASEFNRLRHLQPYPNRKNLEKLEEQKAEASQVINAFQTDLAKKEFPVEPMSPEQFQDRLKAAVSDTRAKATEAGVKLPDKFYLGFEPYETAPPEKDAAAPLGRQLKAIQWVIQQIIASRVSELRALSRTPLPEEKNIKGRSAGSNPNRGGNPPGGARGGGAGSRKDLVTYHPFDVVIFCRQPQLASVLNTVIDTKSPQFYVPRAIRIKNEKDKGPPRGEDTAAAAAAPGPDGKPPAAAVNYIVGEEKIEAAIRFDIVDFAEVATK
jgi:hypothetical protein